MNCLFCADSSAVRQLPDPELKEIIAKIRDNRARFDSLIITGGEPTIYKSLLKVIKYAKDVCKYSRISLVTNGILLSYEDFMDKLIECGVDSFQISYFALDEIRYNGLARTKDAFNLANIGLKNAIKSGRGVRINLVINKLNYSDLPKIVEHLINLRVNSINLAFMNPIGTSVKNGKSILAVSFDAVMPFIAQSFNKANELNFGGLYIENFPLCIARRWMDKISDLEKPIDNSDYYSQGKIKPAKCKACVYNELCGGVWLAYAKQFGDEELKPIILPLKIKSQNKIYHEENSKHSLSRDYSFEIAGIELGIKKASVFYLKRKQIPQCTQELKSLGYFCEISDFSYNTTDELTKKIDAKTEGGDYSLYFSKDAEICKRLKYLDYCHQFKIREPSGMPPEEIFSEIGDILGYPKCCSKFLQSCHDTNEYEKIFKANREYQDETIYKILALKNSRKVLHQLNNFSISFPTFFKFFVCRYDCENALGMANRLLHYTKERNPSEYETLIKSLKTPMLFFSAYRIINLEDVEKKGNIIHYSGCSYRGELLQGIGKGKIDEFRKRFQMLSEGDSFKIDDNKILVYKGNNLVHYIKKKNLHDGIFIKFD